MSQLLGLALNDLRLTVRDRASFFWMLAFPLLMMWLFGQMGSGGSSDPKISLSVVDEDGGWLSRALIAELKDETVDLRELSPGETASAEQRVRTLVIPEGFTGKTLEGKQQVLRLEKAPDSSESFGMAAQMHIVRAIGRTLARLVEMRTLGNEGSPLAALDARREFEALGERSPLVTLDVSTAGEGRRVPSGYAQSVPGILTMMVLMMTLIYGSVFLTMEKREGMLRRQATLPLSRGRIIGGKLLGRLMIAALQTVVLLLAAVFLFRLDLGRSPAGLLLVLAGFAVAVSGLSIMMGALLRTPEQAGSLGWIIAMVLAALGGCWWPSEVMPRWLWSAAHVLPTAWAMDALHALISFGRGLEAVLLPSLILVGFGALFSALGARLLRFT